MNIIFNSKTVLNARSSIEESFRKNAFEYIKNTSEKYLDFNPVPIKGKFNVPDFYKDRKNRDKKVKFLETSANLMIAHSNIYMITGEEKYANKIIELASIWTDSIVDYATEQSQYEANWDFQTMSVAVSNFKNKRIDTINRFIVYDHKQCLKLEKLNQRTNNLRIWLGAHMIASGINKNDQRLFERACDIYKKTINENVAKDGYMPKEVSRANRGIHYTFFALDALFFIAEAAFNQNTDLYGYEFKGKSLKKAVEYIIPFIYEPEKWPWSSEPQDFSVFPKNHSGWCELAYKKWKLKGLEKFLVQNRPIFDSRFGGAQTLFNGLKI